MQKMTLTAGVEARIRAYLSEEPLIVAAYLFGSVAEGLDHRLSDVDIALLLEDDAEAEAAFELRLRAMDELARICQRSVDVVILNHTPPLLRYQVLKHGRLLYERHHVLRCLFEMRTYNEYFDLKFYLDYHRQKFVARVLKEGFGGGYRGNRDALAEARRLSATLAAIGQRSPG